MKFTHIPMTSFLIAIAHPAFAHKVPYGASKCAISDEQADAEEIPLCTKEEKEKSAATAYCKFLGHPNLESCVQGITNYGMAEAAGKCVDESLQKQVDLQDELIGHKKGNTPGSSDRYWHADYKYSKEDGYHRHDWSEGAKNKAGMEYGTAAVRNAKDRSSVNKSTDESSTDWNVGGIFKSIFSGPLLEVGGEVNANRGGEKKASTERGPLTQSEIDKVYNDAKKQAETNPNLSNVSPDILCEQNKPKCSTSFSRDYANDDFKSEAQKPATDISSGGSGSASGNKGSDNKPTPPPSKSTTKVTPPSHEKKDVYAGDPAPVTKPDEMLANWEEDNLNSSISNCLLETFKEQLSQDNNKTYSLDSPNLTPEQRKKEVQGLLRKGICDTKYYGQSFCQKHKNMKLTGREIQNPQEEEITIFEELQDQGKMNFGNPADYQDRTPIDFSRLPRTSPNDPETKIIGIPSRGSPSPRALSDFE